MLNVVIYRWLNVCIVLMTVAWGACANNKSGIKKTENSEFAKQSNNIGEESGESGMSSDNYLPVRSKQAKNGKPLLNTEDSKLTSQTDSCVVDVESLYGKDMLDYTVACGECKIKWTIQPTDSEDKYGVIDQYDSCDEDLVVWLNTITVLLEKVSVEYDIKSKFQRYVIRSIVRRTFSDRFKKQTINSKGADWRRVWQEQGRMKAYARMIEVIEEGDVLIELLELFRKHGINLRLIEVEGHRIKASIKNPSLHGKLFAGMLIYSIE
jgi:hypothetical protein